MTLSEISSQFHDECRAVLGRRFMESVDASASARRNLVFGPLTLMTGWRPMVFVTTPPHPASKARMMLASDSVGGADASRNGFAKRRPVNVVDKSAMTPLLCFGKGSIVTRSRQRGADRLTPAMRRIAAALAVILLPVAASLFAQNATTNPAPSKPTLQKPAPPPKADTPAGTPAPQDKPLTVLPYTPSLDVSAMDKTADPCNDFYQYTCGGWMAHNPIPADQASWSVYGKVSDEN